ncbi:MAG: hypothetical protein F6K45_10050 [Kamptonema sp. SIO1D9]|nr:hypothetical protein [Kamptonema sp. SIO1D9]
MNFLSQLSIVTLCTTLLTPIPTTAVQLNFNLEGDLKTGGFFQGNFAYDSNTPDSNEFVINQGVFYLSSFEIKIFNAENILQETINDDNSEAFVSLFDNLSTPKQTDIYIFSTTPSDFFATGSFYLYFNWLNGGSPNTAPIVAPGDFIEGTYSRSGYEGLFNPTPVKDAEITPVSVPESSNFWALLLFSSSVLFARKMLTTQINQSQENSP